MKPHWSTAEPRIQRKIEDVAGSPVQVVGGQRSPAATHVAAMLAAYRHGFAYDPPDLPLTAELAALVKGNDPVALARFRRENVIELDEESKAAARWSAFAKWRSEPSNEEIAEAGRADREREALEQRIQSRARAIIAAEDAARVTRALEQARKELAQ